MLWQDDFDRNEAGRAEGNGAAGGLLRTVQWGARICARHAGRGPLAVLAGEHTGAEAPHHGASLIRGWHATPGLRSWARTGEMRMLLGGVLAVMGARGGGLDPSLTWPSRMWERARAYGRG